MNGFVDLVFEYNGRYYLADYKSNWLGNSQNAYELDRIRMEMNRHQYHLQYGIYLIAVCRYLKCRIDSFSYETHVGGVLYLFLRGMRPDMGENAGVFTIKPSFAALEKFARSLLGEDLL